MPDRPNYHCSQSLASLKSAHGFRPLSNSPGGWSTAGPSHYQHWHGAVFAAAGSTRRTASPRAPRTRRWRRGSVAARCAWAQRPPIYQCGRPRCSVAEPRLRVRRWPVEARLPIMALRAPALHCSAFCAAVVRPLRGSSAFIADTSSVAALGFREERLANFESLQR